MSFPKVGGVHDMRVFGFLFDTESKFGRLMTRIGIIAVSNLLFLLFCVPVVTVGASYTALYHVMLKEFRSPNDINPFREFWNGFRTNLKQATLCWLASLALLLFGCLEVYWCRQIGGFFSYIEISLWTVGGVGLVVLMYLFPVIAAFENTVSNLVKNSVFLIMKKPLVTVGVAFCNIVPLAITYLDEVNRPAYAFIWFFGGFALTAWVCAWLLLKVFLQYLP